MRLEIFSDEIYNLVNEELISLRRKYERLEDRLKVVEEKVGIKPV